MVSCHFRPQRVHRDQTNRNLSILCIDRTRTLLKGYNLRRVCILFYAEQVLQYCNGWKLLLFHLHLSEQGWEVKSQDKELMINCSLMIVDSNMCHKLFS